MMNKKHLTTLGAMLLFLVSLPLVGCAPQDKHVLKLGANGWLGYQAFFEAQKQSYWDTGQVMAIELGSSTEVMRALSNKSIDLAALTLDELVTARLRDSQLQIVTVVDFSFGGDVLIARPELQSLQDLRGKTIALENTALGAVMLDAVLRHAGLSPADVKLSPLTFDEHADALQNGEADAVITFEPVRSQLLAQGYRDLFNSRAIPDTIVDVLVVSESTAKRYPDRIRAMVSGFFRARSLILAEDAAVIAAIGRRTRLSSDAVVAAFGQLNMPDLEENKALISQCDKALRPTAEKLLKLMLERRIINQKVNLNNLCNKDIIHGVVL